MKSITLETLTEISADYTPERPAPFCQDHDDPRFSDCGNIAEVDNITIELYGVDITDTILSYEPELYDRIFDLIHVEGKEKCGF